MTKVKFYTEPVFGVFAYFPDEKYYHETAGGVDHRMRTCYAHVGQHSSCHPDYLKGKKLATIEQYADLLSELKGQGYDDLIVLNIPLSKEDKRKLDIEAGKIWQVYLDTEPESILFEGTESACRIYIRKNYSRQYKQGIIRIAKVIWEKQAA